MSVLRRCLQGSAKCWAQIKAAKPLLIKGATPLVSGLIVFFFFIYAAQSDQWYSTKYWAMVPVTAFQGVNLVYAMLYASIATVLVGTILYSREIREMERLVEDTPGEVPIRRAHTLLILTIIGVAVAIFAPLLWRHGVVDSDSCTLHALHGLSYRHDAVIIGTFAAFLVVDCLTMRGIGQALKARLGSDKNDHAAKLAETYEFAKLQLWLIDIPVLVGASASVAITLNAATLSGWDASLLRLDPSVRQGMEIARSTNMVICSKQFLTLEQFAESASQIFSAGIAMGYLAAHVLMSQLVFIILNFVHARRQKKIDAPTPATVVEVLS